MVGRKLLLVLHKLFPGLGTLLSVNLDLFQSFCCLPKLRPIQVNLYSRAGLLLADVVVVVRLLMSLDAGFNVGRRPSRTTFCVSEISDRHFVTGRKGLFSLGTRFSVCGLAGLDLLRDLGLVRVLGIGLGLIGFDGRAARERERTLTLDSNQHLSNTGLFWLVLEGP